MAPSLWCLDALARSRAVSAQAHDPVLISIPHCLHTVNFSRDEHSDCLSIDLESPSAVVQTD